MRVGFLPDIICANQRLILEYMTSPWIENFEFKVDKSKPGRILSSAKVGDIYMSRVEIQPGVITGNYYHKKTRVMFYVESGTVEVGFSQLNGEKKERSILSQGKRVIHIPPFIAQASKNVGESVAVLVFFSDKPLRSPDCFPFVVLE